MAEATGLTERQHAILDLVRENGVVQVEPLASKLSVTPQTIRRDLNRLYSLTLLRRVHGGAVVQGNVENLGYGARKVLMADEKSSIARRAATLIPDDSSLVINIGTTTERVADFLSSHKGLLVITNNMNVATTLWPSSHHKVMVAGGSIRPEDGGITGASAEDFINCFKVDYAVIGCSAIDGNGEILDYDLTEVRITQSIIRCAKSVILVADSMKFRRRAPAKIGNLEEVDYLVTDPGFPSGTRELCDQTGVCLEVAGEDRNGVNS